MGTEPNMGLPLPIVGTTVAAPGDWGDLLLQCLTLIGQHDHNNALTRGVKINQGTGVTITTDLDLNSQLAKNLAALVMLNQGAALVTSAYLKSLQAVGGELYWVDGTGAAVQITTSGVVKVADASQIQQTIQVSGNYTVPYDSRITIIQCSTNIAAMTLTLHAASAGKRVMYIVDSGGNAGTNNITLQANGTDTINALSGQKVIRGTNNVVTLICDGISKWNTE